MQTFTKLSASLQVPCRGPLPNQFSLGKTPDSVYFRWNIFRTKRGTVDIRDVARRAKVSTATVSRTVNQVASVDAQLAKRVWKAIEELGYYPNRQARALVSGRSHVFGLIVSEITNPFPRNRPDV